jgi:hypothetical protein
MAIQRLNTTMVERLTEPGRKCDGGGLYVYVKDDGTKFWEYRYTQIGRTRTMGLGSADTVTLDQARVLAAKAREVHRDGRDPIAERDSAKAAGLTPFRACFDLFWAKKKIEFANPKHREQWVNTIATYAYPVIGDMPVAQVATRHVMKVLEPIWLTKNETASRLRGRIETVLDWAKANSYRTGDNPARWEGHLVHLLAKRSRVHRVTHMTALDYHLLPTYMRQLRALGGRRGEDCIGPRALEFTILTAVRTGDIIGRQPGKDDDATHDELPAELAAKLALHDARPPMTWDAVNLTDTPRRHPLVDLDSGGNGLLPARCWLIPKTKTSIEHFVPLTDPALAVLHTVKALGIPGEIVFPSLLKPGRPISNGTMRKVARSIDPQYGPLDVHGFRSCFKDWAGEETEFDRFVIEAVLAHGKIDGKVEAAYRHKDFFKKRTRLMMAWASYADSAPHNVVALRARSA